MEIQFYIEEWSKINIFEEFFKISKPSIHVGGKGGNLLSRGLWGGIWKYLRAKLSFDSDTNSCKICNFPFVGQILNFKKSIFFKNIEIAMKCALVKKYCFRKLKMDSKHPFPMKYYGSGHMIRCWKMGVFAVFAK